MKEVTLFDKPTNFCVSEKMMTVREVADALGYDPRTIQMKVKELFPEIVTERQTTYLNELQVTAVKKACEKNFAVHTRLEVLGNALKAMSDLQALYDETAQELETEKAAHNETKAKVADQAETIKLIADNSADRQYKQTLRAECTALIRRLAKDTGEGYSGLWNKAYEGFFAMHNFDAVFRENFRNAKNKIDFLAGKKIGYLKDLKQAIVSLFAGETV